MQEIPYLKHEQGRTTLIVDGCPFFILGGELHNSSGSDLRYLETSVWPALRQLGGNCYLTPVYWEALEPQRGCFDFTLVDGVIDQARRENVRLVLLWFGLWKNGGSSYVPAWMKTDDRYFYMQGQDGRLIESVSPFCREAVEADAAAFGMLMEHLRQIDAQRTVIMVQVENEVGVWGHPRDYSPAAEAAFHGAIPSEMAALYGVSGTWEEAFGLNACEYFMAWALACAVETIAARGKAVYPLPLFMNCVPSGMGISQLAGSCPSGGPVVRVHDIWRKAAPSIELYGPDIYAPNFTEIAGSFAASNALIIPELGAGTDNAAKALFAAAAYNLICFSPFGIDGFLAPLSENDMLAQVNMFVTRPMGNGGKLLAEAYRLLKLLWPEIRAAQEENRIYAFLQEGMGSEFVLDDYVLTIQYGGTGRPGMLSAPERADKAAMGGGFIIRESADRFLVCGMNCSVQVKPRYASRYEQVFILEKREMNCQPDGLTPGRMLNGDERNFLRLGETPCVQLLQYYRRTR